MLVKCTKCKKNYERFDIGSYGYPYLCLKCRRKEKALKVSLLFLLISISIISTNAMPQVILSDTNTNNIIQLLKANTTITINSQCIDNGTFCSSSSCNISIFYPDNTIFINNKLMNNNISFYSYTLPNSSILGKYQCSIICCDNSRCGTQSCDFLINQTGTEFTVSQAILYIIALSLMILMFLGCFLGAMKIPWKHGYDDNGKVVSVNDLKYFKLVFIVFSYVMLLFIVAFAKALTENLLSYNTINVVFEWAYWIMLGLIFPILVVSFVIGLMVFVDNHILKKKVKRGNYR